ncbi:Thylakoid lumenal 17.9 kDa protein-chloroplastic, partial [Striga hermonthica]
MASGHLRLHISPANSPLLLSLPLKRCAIACTLKTHGYDTNPKPKPQNWSKTLISLAVAVALVTPLPCSAIPSFNSQSFSNTPFSQSQNLPTGLENGKIRVCPSINPSCISSNPKSSNFAFPWKITGYSSESVAIQ